MEQKGNAMAFQKKSNYMAEVEMGSPKAIKNNPTPASSGLVCNIFTNSQKPTRIKIIGVTGYKTVLYGRGASGILRRKTITAEVVRV